MTGRLPPWNPRPHIPGTTPSGYTGLEIDPRGRLASRTCVRCRGKLDDVEDLGTHPGCEPQAEARRARAELDPPPKPRTVSS